MCKQPEGLAGFNDIDEAAGFFFLELGAADTTPEMDMNKLEDMIFANDEGFMGVDTDDGDAEPDELDPLDEIVGRMMDQLPLDDYVSLCDRWRKLHALSQTYSNGKIPVGSGCSGSGMDVHVLNTLSRVMLARTGISVQWSCAFECEYDPAKRQWLQYFSNPITMAEDVTQIADSPMPPDHLFLLTFGYSCADFQA